MDNSIDKLWDIIDKENIAVTYRNLSKTPEHVHGIYLYEDRVGPLIVLDIYLHHSHRLHKCVLAEEIGHFYTAPRTNLLTVHTSANLQTMESQDERKAAQWATDYLIPDSELVKALELGNRSCFDLAEYFDVTEWFMYRKLGLLKMCFRRTGLKVRGRDLFDIYMQPCYII